MSWSTDENLDPQIQDWAEAYKELCGIIIPDYPVGFRFEGRKRNGSTGFVEEE